MSELLLDISQMREARARVDRTFAVEAVPSDPEAYHLVEPIVLAADVQRDRDQFRLAGTVKTAIELTCCRCLEPFRVPVSESFDVLFLPHTASAGGDEHEVEDDDLSTAYYDAQVIDLGQLMQEQFYLAVPMKPLCGDDCRGLCPVCGVNLNTGSCTCAKTWGESPMAVLRNLVKKD
jgi:uncharacterized protein